MGAPLEPVNPPITLAAYPNVHNPAFLAGVLVLPKFADNADAALFYPILYLCGYNTDESATLQFVGNDVAVFSDARALFNEAPAWGDTAIGIGRT